MATKQKTNKETQLLELLKNILPKTVSDPKLVQKIYTACETELKASQRVVAFDKFCQHCELTNLNPDSVTEITRQFENTFGQGTVSIVPDEEKQAVKVEVKLPDSDFKGLVKVKNPEDPLAEEEEEIKLKYVAFPVCLPGDPELVWILAKKENMTPDEACIALDKVQADFWGSKTGQKLIRDRVERSFPEFMVRVPAKLLTEVGLKRHYKEPEPVKPLRPPQP